MINKKSIIIIMILFFSMLNHASEKKGFFVFGNVGPSFLVKSAYSDFDISYHPTIEVEGGIGYQLSRVIALSLNVNHSRFLHDKDVRDDINSEFKRYLDLTNILLNIKVIPFKGRITPYLIVGGGFSLGARPYGFWADTGEEAIFKTSYCLIYSGLGLQYHVSEKWDCFMEAGFYYRFLDESYKTNGFLPIKLGMAYRF